MSSNERHATIENVGMLDLTSMSEDDLSQVSSISNVGAILAPKRLGKALMAISQHNVGAVISVPDTLGKIKVYSGQMTVSGSVFANKGGSPDDVLVLLGETVVTSPIEAIGFKELFIGGNLIVPEGSADLMASIISMQSGQVIYFSAAKPRVFTGMESFSNDFFELIPTGASLILLGDHQFEDDVEPELLQQKVGELIVAGRVTASKKLMPALQWMAELPGGVLRVSDSAPKARPTDES